MSVCGAVAMALAWAGFRPGHPTQDVPNLPLVARCRHCAVSELQKSPFSGGSAGMVRALSGTVRSLCGTLSVSRVVRVLCEEFRPVERSTLIPLSGGACLSPHSDIEEIMREKGEEVKRVQAVLDIAGEEPPPSADGSQS